MDARIGQIIEGTFVVVALFLIVKNAPGFSQTIGAIASAYSGSVKALQGQ